MLCIIRRAWNPLRLPLAALFALVWALMITSAQGMSDMDMGTQQAGGMEALVGKEFGGLLAGRQATNLQVSVLVLREVNGELRGRY
jgi:hypothetical protein